ncbi:hypothetical protein EIZ39_25185 [Ammoniphilus sp. CFH 90114]|nr:hypothetical protein EIZ39_25185 [Ammoniphilus sp. CFH 90114]
MSPIITNKNLEYNVALLKQEDWFADIMQDEKNQYLILNNILIHNYLIDDKKVAKLKDNAEEREHFLEILEEQKSHYDWSKL